MMKHFETPYELNLGMDVVVRGYTTRNMQGRITAEIQGIWLKVPRHQSTPDWQTGTTVDLLPLIAHDVLVKIREAMTNQHYVEALRGREAVGEVG